MTTETPKEKFLRLCPSGFSDSKFIKDERSYKSSAHAMWCKLLNRKEFNRLLADEQYHEICRRAVQVEPKTKPMLSRYEKAALHDAVKGDKPAELAANGLFDLVYGEESFEKRFEEFAADLESLPRKKTSPATWTIATMFPFLALPNEHIFLKPKVTQAAAKRRRFSLKYKPELNWLTYSCLLQFAELLKEEVADLKPRDMIDIQSYI